MSGKPTIWLLPVQSCTYNRVEGRKDDSSTRQAVLVSGVDDFQNSINDIVDIRRLSFAESDDVRRSWMTDFDVYPQTSWQYL